MAEFAPVSQTLLDCYSTHRPAITLNSIPRFSAPSASHLHLPTTAVSLFTAPGISVTGDGLRVYSDTSATGLIRSSKGGNTRGCYDAFTKLYLTHALPYWPISCLALQQWIRSVSFRTAREEFSLCQSSLPEQTWWRGAPLRKAQRHQQPQEPQHRKDSYDPQRLVRYSPRRPPRGPAGSSVPQHPDYPKGRRGAALRAAAPRRQRSREWKKGGGR